MPVIINLPPPLFAIDQGHPQVDASTLREAIEQLNERYPDFKSYLIVDGKLRRSLIVSFNGMIAQKESSLDTYAPDGTIIDIFHEISGG